MFCGDTVGGGCGGCCCGVGGGVHVNLRRRAPLGGRLLVRRLDLLLLLLPLCLLLLRGWPFRLLLLVGAPPLGLPATRRVPSLVLTSFSLQLLATSFWRVISLRRPLLMPALFRIIESDLVSDCKKRTAKTDGRKHAGQTVIVCRIRSSRSSPTNGTWPTHLQFLSAAPARLQ